MLNYWQCCKLTYDKVDKLKNSDSAKFQKQLNTWCNIFYLANYPAILEHFDASRCSTVLPCRGLPARLPWRRIRLGSRWSGTRPPTLPFCRRSRRGHHSRGHRNSTTWCAWLESWQSEAVDLNQRNNRLQNINWQVILYLPRSINKLKKIQSTIN